MNKRIKLTRVFHVVTSVTENLQRTDEVQGIETLVQGEENLDRLEGSRFSVLWNDCTHLAGIL